MPLDSRLAPGNVTPSVDLIYIGANLVLFELWSGKHMYFIIKYSHAIAGFFIHLRNIIRIFMVQKFE